MVRFRKLLGLSNIQNIKNIKIISIILLVAFAISAGIYYASTSKSKMRKVFARDRVVKVEAEPVEIGPVTRELSTVGTLRAAAEVTIKPEVEGKIEKLFCVEGSKVSAGQLLLKIDDSKYKAEYQDAQVRVRWSQVKFEREEKLFKQNVSSSAKFEEAATDLKLNQALLHKKKLELEKTSIYAPFEGYVTVHDYHPGSYVNSSNELFKVIKINPMYVDFRVPERFLSDIKEGQIINVTADGFPEQEFIGIVFAIDPKIDPMAHSFIVRAKLENQDESLRPGLFVRVKLALYEVAKAMKVPESAIMRDATNQEFVFIVSHDNVAYKKLVMTGQRKKGMVEITDGLLAEDLVIATGHRKGIVDGTPVSVIGRDNLTDEEEGFNPTPVLDSLGISEKEIHDQKEAQSEASGDTSGDISADIKAEEPKAEELEEDKTTEQAEKEISEGSLHVEKDLNLSQPEPELNAASEDAADNETKGDNS